MKWESRLLPGQSGRVDGQSTMCTEALEKLLGLFPSAHLGITSGRDHGSHQRGVVPTCGAAHSPSAVCESPEVIRKPCYQEPCQPKRALPTWRTLASMARNRLDGRAGPCTGCRKAMATNRLLWSRSLRGWPGPCAGCRCPSGMVLEGAMGWSVSCGISNCGRGSSQRSGCPRNCPICIPGVCNSGPKHRGSKRSMRSAVNSRSPLAS